MYAATVIESIAHVCRNCADYDDKGFRGFCAQTGAIIHGVWHECSVDEHGDGFNGFSPSEAAEEEALAEDRHQRDLRSDAGVYYPASLGVRHG